MLQCLTVHCCALQFDAVSSHSLDERLYCHVLQVDAVSQHTSDERLCVEVRCKLMQCLFTRLIKTMSQCVVVRCSLMQCLHTGMMKDCVAVYCSAL